MYEKPFYIKDSVWNNSFSYDKRKTKEIYVPSLIEADFNEISLWEEVVFCDYDFLWNLVDAKWLKNFYKLNWKWKTIYLFDNHNHAFYFWYLERYKGNIWNSNLLFHVDEHSDMRDPWVFLEKKDLEDIENVFNYTNFTLNVWNYIIPALKDWIISEVAQIRNEDNLNNYFLYDFQNEKRNIILNLDLDFFEPELDFIDYELKKKVIVDIASKSSFITVSTSPFFINQELALKVFFDLFS
jgi:hypothetical protein